MFHFEVGDKVHVRKIEEMPGRYDYHCSWCEEMDKYCDTIATIRLYDIRQYDDGEIYVYKLAEDIDDHGGCGYNWIESVLEPVISEDIIDVDALAAFL